MDNNQYVQLQTLYLKGSGVGSTDTSIDLSSMTFPVSGDTVVMADFGAMGYATLEPGTAREENISFTGITQNADGSAQLTGVTRGLDFAAPYTNVAALQQTHAGGTALVVSNSSAFYNELAAKDNDETITGTWTFPNGTPPTLDSYAAPTADAELAAKKYVDDVAGGGTASINRTVVSGTAGETMAAGNAVYFDETENEWMLANAGAAATSENVQLGIAQGSGVDGGAISEGVLIFGREENQSGLTAGDRIYLTDVDGVLGSAAGTVEVEVGHAISATAIDFTPRYDKSITEDEQDALAGTSGTPSSTNKYVTEDDVDDAATASKIARRDGNGDVLVATTPTDGDAAVSLTHAQDDLRKVQFSVADVTVANTTTETAIATISLPGGVLKTANAVRIEAPISNFGIIRNSDITVRLKYGTTTIATALISCNDGSGAAAGFTTAGGKIEALLFANADTAVQEGSVSIMIADADVEQNGNQTNALCSVAAGTAAEDSTGALTLQVTVQWDAASASNTITAPHSIITRI